MNDPYRTIHFLKDQRHLMPSVALQLSVPTSAARKYTPVENTVAVLDIDTQPSFNIFHLPPELRLAIYEIILDGHRAGLALLQTCRHIHMEAQDIVYQRPTSFTSQANFFSWIDRSRARSLNRVRTVKLRLTDVDLTPLFSITTPQRQTRTSAWSLYKSDLERLEQALSALPNLTRLTIIPPRIGRSHLLKNMYHSFLAEIPRRCPKLRQLEIHDSDTLLAAVPALKNVRSVTFTESGSGAGSGSKDIRRDSARASRTTSDTSVKRTQ